MDNGRRKTKQKHNTICIGHHYKQTNTDNVNKISNLLQTTGGKDEPIIVFMIIKNWTERVNVRLISAIINFYLLEQ